MDPSPYCIFRAIGSALRRATSLCIEHPSSAAAMDDAPRMAHVSHEFNPASVTRCRRTQSATGYIKRCRTLLQILLREMGKRLGSGPESPVNGVRSRTGDTTRGQSSWNRMRRVSALRWECWTERNEPGKGRVGTIERTYGHPNYLAVDVRFEDGSVELYWYHELRTMKRQPLP